MWKRFFADLDMSKYVSSLPYPTFFDQFINELEIAINAQCQEMYKQINSPDILNLIRKAQIELKENNTTKIGVAVKNFFTNFYNYVSKKPRKPAQAQTNENPYLQKTYYEDITNIINSILQYWIPLYDSNQDFYEFYSVIQQFILQKIKMESIFIIIPKIEEFITMCKFFSIVTDMAASEDISVQFDNFWPTFALLFENYTKEELQIKINNNNIKSIGNSIRNALSLDVITENTQNPSERKLPFSSVNVIQCGTNPETGYTCEIDVNRAWELFEAVQTEIAAVSPRSSSFWPKNYNNKYNLKEIENIAKFLNDQLNSSKEYANFTPTQSKLSGESGRSVDKVEDGLSTFEKIMSDNISASGISQGDLHLKINEDEDDIVPKIEKYIKVEMKQNDITGLWPNMTVVAAQPPAGRVPPDATPFL